MMRKHKLGASLGTFFLNLWLFFTSLTAECPAGWPALEDICALSSQLDGNLYLPGDQGYADAALNLNNMFTNAPSIVIMAETVGDVQKAILFAQEHRIRPTVASSGHCFLGRSSGNGTIHINVSRFKRFDVNFNDPTSVSGLSVQLGPGNDWERVYREANNNDIFALGGFCPTVAPGGYLSGGGFGSLSRLHGFGVDNVLSLNLVTPSGDFLEVGPNSATMHRLDGTVSELPGEDLFWALRGGLGGTFGIVTEFQYQVYPAPENLISVVVSYPMYDDDGNSIAEEILEFYFDWVLSIEPVHEIGASISMTNGLIEGTDAQGVLSATLTYHGLWEDGWSYLEPMYTYRPEWQYESGTSVENLTSWLEFAEPNVPEDPVGRWYTTSRFFFEEEIQPGEVRQDLIRTLLSMREYEAVMTCHLISFGGKAREFDFESSSIGPSYRSALIHDLCMHEPSYDNLQRDFIQYRVYSDAVYQFGDGMYPNEAEVFHNLDWKREYWGPAERYERLLNVKDVWDPENIFTCHHCVGSDREYTFNELPPLDESHSCSCPV